MTTSDNIDNKSQRQRRQKNNDDYENDRDRDHDHTSPRAGEHKLWHGTSPAVFGDERIEDPADDNSWQLFDVKLSERKTDASPLGEERNTSEFGETSDWLMNLSVEAAVATPRNQLTASRLRKRYGNITLRKVLLYDNNREQVDADERQAVARTNRQGQPAARCDEHG